MSSSTLRSEPITVEVANRIVTLGGSAGSTTSAQLAESLASSVSGVSRVFNTIQVAGAPPPTPPPTIAEAPAERAPDVTPAEVPTAPGAGRREVGQRDEAIGDLLEKGKREFMAGNAQGALQACQAALQIEPRNPLAQACVVKARAALGGPVPRRR